MGLFRLLFYFLIGLFIFRLISSLFRPRRAQQRSYGNQNNQSFKRKEGEVSIKVDNSTNKKQFKENDGDYIDYEDA